MAPEQLSDLARQQVEQLQISPNIEEAITNFLGFTNDPRDSALKLALVLCAFGAAPTDPYQHQVMESMIADNNTDQFLDKLRNFYSFDVTAKYMDQDTLQQQIDDVVSTVSSDPASQLKASFLVKSSTQHTDISGIDLEVTEVLPNFNPFHEPKTGTLEIRTKGPIATDDLRRGLAPYINFEILNLPQGPQVQKIKFGISRMLVQ